MSPSVVTSSAADAGCAIDRGQSRRLRTWLLTNAPSPYQAELFTAISSRKELQFTVRFMRTSSTSGRAVVSEFDSITMSGLAPRSWRDEVRLHPQAIAEAAFGRFDCFVLSGLYTSITFLGCAFVLAIRRKPWIIWLERPRAAAPHGRHSRRLPRALSSVKKLRDRVRRWLVRSASRVLCIGRAAQEEYGRLGAPQEKLDLLPYCCDLHRYDDVDAAQIAKMKDRFDLGEKTVFLFSGQLAPRKGVETLIRAFERLAAESPDVALVLLGDGPQRDELESLVSREHESQVHFLGHLAQDKLPAVFRAADVFVFPSRHDGWGVVINEACASRLPIIVSHQTGAAHDLVEHGQSGFRHDADDVEAFFESMKYLADNPNERTRMGTRSRELVEQFSPECGARLFLDSVLRAVG